MKPRRRQWMRLQVVDREEALLIADGLKTPEVRALVKVMGALSRIPTDRAKVRALRYLMDRMAETANERAIGAVFSGKAKP